MKVQVKHTGIRSKFKKTGMTYIDITGLGNRSKISVTVTGAARFKKIKQYQKVSVSMERQKKELTILRSKRI